MLPWWCRSCQSCSSDAHQRRGTAADPAGCGDAPPNCSMTRVPPIGPGTNCGTLALCYPTPCVWPSLCFFLSPLEVLHLPTPHTVTTRRNLKSLSPSTTLSSLPSPEQFSLLSTDEVSSTLLSSLSYSLDSLFPFTSRPVRPPPPPLQAAERKWKRSDCADDLCHYLHLLCLCPRKLFSMFSSLLTPPLPSSQLMTL